MALQNGSNPLFFNAFSSWVPFLPYPGQLVLHEPEKRSTPTSLNKSETFLNYVDDKLSRAWKDMARFCSLINLVAESRHRISTEVFLDTMASVMYRLLDMSFEAGSANEAIRLGLLAFSSSIFLQWRQLGLSYAHLATSYRNCIGKLETQHLSPQLLLWLLMIGAISVFDGTDDEWLKPWLCVVINYCEIENWRDVQDLLKSFMWIGLVHDEPGKNVFDSTFIPDVISSPDHSHMSTISLSIYGSAAML